MEVTEVAAVIEAIVGRCDPDDDAVTWCRHLASRQSLFAAVVDERAAMRAAVAADLHSEGESIARIGDRLGLSKSFAQQLIDRAKAGRPIDRITSHRPKSSPPVGNIGNS
jgi:hypothetical protein